jgi:small-conductance mechanosensitive channel
MVLMEKEAEQGAGGAEQGTTEPVKPVEGATEPTVPEQKETKSLNSQAKALPWVQDLVQKAAELDRLKREQADAQAQAERERQLAEGKHSEVIAEQQKTIADLEAAHKRELRRLQLESEFVRAGAPDARVVKIFEDEFNAGEETAAEFVARIRDDDTNAMYFSAQRGAAPRTPPPPAHMGSGDSFDPKWINSDDPKKREAAIKYNREAFWRKVRGGKE